MSMRDVRKENYNYRKALIGVRPVSEEFSIELGRCFTLLSEITGSNDHTDFTPLGTAARWMRSTSYINMLSKGRANQAYLTISDAITKINESVVSEVQSRAKKRPTITVELGKIGVTGAIKRGNEMCLNFVEVPLLGSDANKFFSEGTHLAEQIRQKFGAPDFKGLKLFNKPVLPLAVANSEQVASDLAGFLQNNLKASSLVLGPPEKEEITLFMHAAEHKQCIAEKQTLDIQD